MVSAETAETCFFGPCYLHCFLCAIGATINRGAIRTGLGIERNYLLDLVTNLFCLPCAVVQEYREHNDKEVAEKRSQREVEAH